LAAWLICSSHGLLTGCYVLHRRAGRGVSIHSLPSTQNQSHGATVIKAATAFAAVLAVHSAGQASKPPFRPQPGWCRLVGAERLV
jgi:hypothetical protein